jgi:IS5 family transposase
VNGQVPEILLIRSRRAPRRRRPAKLHADKGYDYDHLRQWLRARHVVPRIARRGIESSARLGQHRWTVERTVSWLADSLACTGATNANPSIYPLTDSQIGKRRAALPTNSVPRQLT